MHLHLFLFQDVTSVSVFTIGVVRRAWIATTVHIIASSTTDMFASSLKVKLMKIVHNLLVYIMCSGIAYL